MCAMQQTLHVNPMKEDRKSTNVPFIAVFSIIFFIWLGVAFNVLDDQSLKCLKKIDENRQKRFFELEGIYLRFTWKFPVCTILSGLIAILYTYLLSGSVGKFIICIAIYFTCIYMLLIITLTIGTILVSISHFQIAFVVIFFLLYAPYIVISFFYSYNMGAKAIFEIVRDSSRAVISRSAISLFACGMYVMIVLISAFTVYISKCIVLYYYNYSTSYIIFSCLNLYGALTLINFFINLIHIIISNYVIDWFWMKDQNLSPLTFSRSVGRALSYHLGTVAFASIPLLSYILSIFQVCRCRDSDNDIEKKYNIITRFYSQVCTVTSVVDFSLIQTSIYGYDHSTAIMAAHDVVSQNNHRTNIAVSQVCFIVTGTASLLMAIPFAFDDIRFLVYSILIPYHLVLRTAVRALLVNKMIIHYTSEALKEDCDSAQHPVLPQSQTGV